MSESNTDSSKDTAAEMNGAAENMENASPQVEQLKADAEKYKNDFLYLRAEFENYKRNAIKERADLLRYGAERFVRDFLGSLDNFDRALSVQVTPENYPQFVQGMQMIAKQMNDLLAKNNVTEVLSDQTPFDPLIHEAVGTETSDKVSEGHVLRTLQKAYKMHDKLIRPAQVIVAKKS